MQTKNKGSFKRPPRFKLIFRRLVGPRWGSVRGCQIEVTFQSKRNAFKELFFYNSKYSGQKVSPHSNLSYYDTITIVFTVLVTIFEWKTLTAVVFNRCNMVLLLHISTP